MDEPYLMTVDLVEEQRVPSVWDGPRGTLLLRDYFDVLAFARYLMRDGREGDRVAFRDLRDETEARIAYAAAGLPCPLDGGMPCPGN